MPVINTAHLKPGVVLDTNLQIYNGLDTCVTWEVFDELQSLRSNDTRVYDYERAMQGPMLEMMLRGFKVDEYERRKGIAYLKTLTNNAKGEALGSLDINLNRMAQAIWDRALNPRSPLQMKDFLYGAMQLPEQFKNDKGVRKLSTDREALEKLEVYFNARPIISTILAIRDYGKQRSVLETEIDPDSRIRTSYNIAGTETWRLSSSASAMGTGTNLQNVSPKLRRIFIADVGKKLCVIDLEQAESREVGFKIGLLFNDWTYLDACEGGDLHTLVAKLVWPNLGWTGDAKKDRAIADGNFYREFSYRDMSKRGGHGTNYFGTAFTMARHLKVPVKLIEDFQRAYLARFPLGRWHRWVAEQLQTQQSLDNSFGFGRTFFGRPDDDSTLREAIAFGPQSSTAIRTNLALLRMWKHFESRVEILAQTHDSITFQYPEGMEAQVVPEALTCMSTPMYAPNGRKFDVPGEAKIGWNWGYHHDPSKPTSKSNIFNPNGLLKWKGPGVDLRKRLEGTERPL